MTLKIKPVKLRQSVYVRVPNDIADLIGMNSQAEITLNLVERDEKFLLIYSVMKGSTDFLDDNVLLGKVVPLPQVSSTAGRTAHKG